MGDSFNAYAGPNVDGPTSKSNKDVYGTPGHTVEYNVNVNGNAGTMVCCDGYSPANNGFKPVGCGNENFSGVVEWGNNVAQPAVRCQGVPFGASVEWSHNK